jgi:ACR3 family arsenite transporter
MFFVWSTLTKGNPAYTVVQVATNDLIILVAFVPIVKFLFGVYQVSVPYSTLFVLIPFVTRLLVINKKGLDYFENNFIHKLDNATTLGFLLTSIMIFSSHPTLFSLILFISS